MSEAHTAEPRSRSAREELLRHGSPQDVIRQLSALNGELRLALQNALERIAALEERMGYTGNE